VHHTTSHHATLRYPYDCPDDYAKEERPPAKVCLSFTHDRDFERFRPRSGREPGLRPSFPPDGKEYDGFQQGQD